MMEVIIGLLILTGGFFAVIASLGLVRLPDVLTRMHASTKIGTLSGGLIMAAVALHFAQLGTVVLALAIVVFLVLTAPIAGHMIGRATILTGVRLWSPESEKTGTAEPSKD